jgi:hypothetical protein
MEFERERSRDLLCRGTTVALLPNERGGFIQAVSDVAIKIIDESLARQIFDY